MSSNLAVYCDFDGTVTLKDTTDFLLNTLADPEWLEYEAQWEHGEIGSTECMAKQVPLMKGGWSAIESLLPTVQIDPTFPDFAAWCKSQNVPLYIVSEGLDKVIYTILERHNIVVDGIWANHLMEDDQKQLSLAFPYANPTEGCLAGLCKCAILSKDQTEQHRVVIGDGFSDRCWATQADQLFAKSKLLTYCQEQQVACTPFENFQTIQNTLQDWMDTSLKQPVCLVPGEERRYANG